MSVVWLPVLLQMLSTSASDIELVTDPSRYSCAKRVDGGNNVTRRIPDGLYDMRAVTRRNHGQTSGRLIFGLRPAACTGAVA